MNDTTETSNKPKVVAAKPKPVSKAQGAQFGDPSLSGARVEPVSFDKRTRTSGQHALEIAGLVLSPAQLALAMTVLPLVSGTKPGLVAMLGGLVLGALVCILLQAPLLRYGISLGVLARSAFGTQGARLFSALRLLVLTTFFGGALFLSAQTLFWCILCSVPGTVAIVNRIPLVDGGVSLFVVATALIMALPVWMLSANPSPRVRVALLLPALLLPVLLFALPDNLPMSAAWAMLDVAERTTNTNVFPIFLLSFAWSSAVYLTPASDVRLQPTQIGQTLAVAGAGVLPWLLGSMAMALAVLSSGQSQGGFFDMPSLACRRLSTGLLIPVLGAASIAYVWPIAHSTKRAAMVSAQEILGGNASATALRVVEYAFMLVGLGVAVYTRTRATELLFLNVSLQIVVVAGCLVMLAQYFAVDRTRLVLDDFYQAKGAYRGVLGVLPAGWLSLALGYGVYAYAVRAQAAVATSVGVGLLSTLLAHALLGNVQRLLTRRRA